MLDFIDGRINVREFLGTFGRPALSDPKVIQGMAEEFGGEFTSYGTKGGRITFKNGNSVSVSADDRGWYDEVDAEVAVWRNDDPVNVIGWKTPSEFRAVLSTHRFSHLPS